jgi:tRNA threonylcarbamoyladenosine biosynthesis protein TsaB
MIAGTMRILAADTSTSINTVALCDDGRILAESVVDCGRAHAERLLSTVDWVLAEAGIGLRDIDMLAISAGPGSFTGLRVGVATWKGLALGAGLPLVAVPTLDALARVHPLYEGTLCPLLDAKMGEVFGAVYRFDAGRRRKSTADLVRPVKAILETLEGTVHFLGDGALRYWETISGVLPDAVIVVGPTSVPRASVVAEEAREMLSRGCGTDPAAVTPVYLRKSQAEEAREKAGAS